MNVRLLLVALSLVVIGCSSPKEQAAAAPATAAAELDPRLANVPADYLKRFEKVHDDFNMESMSVDPLDPAEPYAMRLRLSAKTVARMPDEGSVEWLEGGDTIVRHDVQGLARDACSRLDHDEATVYVINADTGEVLAKENIRRAE